MDKKTKDKNITFVIQINETYFKIVKSSSPDNQQVRASLYQEEFAPGISDNDLAQKISQILAKLGFNNHPVIICLPRNQVTCRLSKVPSQDIPEIEKIINFQSSKYLPYQASELINAFDIISKNKDGSAVINHLIVHKNAIERYLHILKALNSKYFKIVLSSYGTAGLFDSWAKNTKSAILIDFDADDLEILVFNSGKLLFSRAFKIAENNPSWQEELVKELSRSIEAYAKESDQPLPLNCIILSLDNNHNQAVQIIKNEFKWQVEFFNYLQDPKFSIDTGLKQDLVIRYSFASLLGLSRLNIADNLNLLPNDLKGEINKLKILRQRFRLLSLAGLALLFLSFGIMKDLDNKNNYLLSLKKEVGIVGKEAKDLEVIEKRIKLLESRTKSAPQVLDFLTEANKAVPDSVYLSSFSYEENQVIIRGQAGELNGVLEFVSGIEKSKAYADYQVKVRYATKRKTQNAEVIDFEIVCLKG